MKHKYNYFYKIINNINGKFYYGIHSTDNLDDGYMGSGTRITQAYKLYGIENFTKEILKFFDNREDLANYESEIVNEELISNKNCYNVSLGGEIGKSNIGLVSVINLDTGETLKITKKEYDNTDIYKGITYNTVTVAKKDNPNNWFRISSDEYKLNKNLYITPFTNKKYNLNKVLVKDTSGNCFYVDKNDERYISGKLKFAYKGYKWTDEQKLKLKQHFKDSNHQKGENNSQYGTKWIYKDNECIKVKKDILDDYLKNGWVLGCLKTRKK